MRTHTTNPEAKSPLDAAVQQRDANVLAMVKTALKNRNVMLAYQPVVLADDYNCPAFYEGLIRVLDETGRVIPAREFISTIETREEGRIIDCLALEFGLKALARASSLRLSINMSPRTIGHPVWEETLKAGLADDPTLAERLIIEITEASAMEMPDLVVNFMHRMQKRGIAFALDDFGAGYTAFRHFKDFYFDLVKIDGSFSRDIHDDTDNQVLVQALQTISRQFDMFVVAEGIERPEEAEYLTRAGIDCMQGYLFGAPAISEPWAEKQAKEAS